MSLQSQTLTLHDFDHVRDTLGGDWDDSAARALPRGLRSGIEGEDGAGLHVHLLERDPRHASDAVLRTVAALADEAVLALRALDRDFHAGVCVKQDLPEYGRVQPIQLSAEAVAALASLGDAGALDIDQYGASGYPGLRRFAEFLLRKANFDTDRCRLTIELFGSDEDQKTFSRGIEDRFELGEPTEQLAAEIAGWKQAKPAGFEVVRGRGVLHQGVAIYRYSGLGLGVEAPLLKLLADNRCELTIQTRIGPALVFLH